jgi:hypothetical protein
MAGSDSTHTTGVAGAFAVTVLGEGGAGGGAASGGGAEGAVSGRRGAVVRVGMGTKRGVFDSKNTDCDASALLTTAVINDATSIARATPDSFASGGRAGTAGGATARSFWLIVERRISNAVDTQFEQTSPCAQRTHRADPQRTQNDGRAPRLPHWAHALVRNGSFMLDELRNRGAAP